MADEDPQGIPIKLPWWVIENKALAEKPDASFEYRLMKALAIAFGALNVIATTEGKVCKEFETCNHKACQSSMKSWVTAQKALADVNALARHE